MASKFDYCDFYCYDNHYIAFNASKYTEEQAEEIAKVEIDNPVRTDDFPYAYYGFGVDDDGEKQNTYWFCDHHPKNGIKLITFKEENR